MAKGIPTKKSEIGPLKVKRLENVPIVSIGAFRMVAEKEDRKTGEKYETDQVNLSIDFDSGFIQRKEHPDGEPVLDDNGNEKPHLINVGYMTLSGHFKSNFVPLLRAAGYDGPEFIDDEGSLTQEAQESIEVEFGTNGLGHNYTGKDWDDLPYYVLPKMGGKHQKRDVEVPVTSFKIKGYELIGRRVDMALEIKNGYNKPTAFIEPRDPAPLGKTAPAPARGMPAAPEEPEDPFEEEETPPWRPPEVVVPTREEHGKAAVYIWKIMEDANIAPERRVSVARHIVSDPSIKSIAEIPDEHARTIRDMYKADASILVRAHSDVFKDDGPDDDDEEF